MIRYLLAMLACLGVASVRAQECPKVDPGEQQVRETECRASGGEWAKFGVRDHLCGVYSCAPKTADGGKPCKNRNDCEYLCVATKPGAMGTAVTGECARVRTPFGCNHHVDGGRIIGRVCVD